MDTNQHELILTQINADFLDRINGINRILKYQEVMQHLKPVGLEIRIAAGGGR
jgi:hypothetical protein